MSGPCNAACRRGVEFCDTVTDTCMHCATLCDPKRHTPSECHRECRDYEWKPRVEKPPDSDTDITVSVNANSPVIWICVVCSLAVILIIILVVCLLRKRRHPSSARDLSDVNVPLAPSLRLAEPGDATCPSKFGLCSVKCCITFNTNNNNGSPSSTVPEIPGFDCQTNRGYGDRNRTNPVYTAQSQIRVTGNAAPDSSVMKSMTSSIDTKTGKDSHHASTNSYSKPAADPSHTSKTISSKTSGSGSQNYATGVECQPGATSYCSTSTQRPLRRDVSNNGGRQKHPPSDGSSRHGTSHCGTMQSGLELNLELESVHQHSGRSVRPESVATTDPGEQGHWNTVIRVYDYIDQKMHELPWIAGCMISNTALKVVVSSSQNNMHEIRQRVRNIIPPDIPSERFLLTFEGPALQTQHGCYGTGGMVHVPSQESSETVRSATATILARHMRVMGGPYGSKAYAFTVGHVIHKDMICKVQSKNDLEKGIVRGRCLDHVDTVGKYLIKDIKHKIYDMAIIELAEQCTIANSRQHIHNGVEVTLRPRVSKTLLKPKDLMPGKRVLIFGGPNNRVIEGRIDRETPLFTCTRDTPQHKRHQTINLIQLSSHRHGDNLIHPGHSGSLVAWYPRDTVLNTGDKSLVLEAFAMVVGINAASPEKGFAVPLWEQMCRVFEQDSRMSEFSARLTFEDQGEDSGVYSAV